MEKMSNKREYDIPDIVDEHFYEMLGEEPVSKVWHDSNLEQPNPKKITLSIFKDKTCPVVGYNSWYDENSIWAYLDDLLNLTHSVTKISNQEPVSEGLEKAAEEWDESLYRSDAFKVGAKWQKENLWKPADGDDLPEYDREVIAILDYDFGHYKVVYAHRPNPNGWNGTNIDTGEKEHFEPAIYDKGGWNQPHVLYWLDARLPYEKNFKED